MAGLEIPEESLRLIDISGDGKIHVKEVVATADWLCAKLQDPKVLLSCKAQLRLTDIADEAIRATAAKVAQGDKITLEDVENAMNNAQCTMRNAQWGVKNAQCIPTLEFQEWLEHEAFLHGAPASVAPTSTNACAIL